MAKTIKNFKMKVNQILFAIVSSAVILTSCSKNDMNTTVPTPAPTVTKIAPDAFNYATDRLVTFTVKLQTNYNKPLPGVMVKLLDATNPANYNLDSDSGRSFIFQGLTDQDGLLQCQFHLDANIDTVLIDPSYIGLARNVKAYMINNMGNAVIGGTGNISGNVVGYNYVPKANPINGIVSRSENMSLISTFGASTWIKPNIQFFNSATAINWNSIGVPNYLDPISDEISASLLSGINASIPENGHVPMLHPEYFKNTVPTDLAITADADVFIGFLYAGTSAQNSVGYYLYPTNNPPKQPSDITNMFYLFPNSDEPAYHNNQVVLSPGNKVHIGTVKAGTSIGFFCIPNGWSGGSNTNAGHTVSSGGGIYYSNPNFNPENDPSLANRNPVRHSVVLNDPGFSQFMIGFEDSYNPNLLPTNTGNNDYNDAVVYITSNPISSIDNTGIPPVANNTDKDGDGVPDIYDAFPNDPTRAYINYFPSSTSYGYIAFEDNFPLKGDYDMNDLVVQYQYKIISNAKNNIVEFYASYTPVAAGASYKNGFGVQFSFAASSVAKVTGQQLNNNYITLSSNGTEAKQTNAVIIPFDNYNDLINNSNGAYFINTLTSLPKETGNAANIYMSFVNPLTPAQFGQAPFDMFAISNMRRGYEIHLPNHAPTALANTSLLGTNDDRSNPSTGTYYVSYDNWPWAMNFLQPFVYPIEAVNVSNAYPHFLDWAKSGGSLFKDWFSNTGSGYRNTFNLYTK